MGSGSIVRAMAAVTMTAVTMAAVTMTAAAMGPACAQTPAQPQPTAPNMPSRQATPPEKVEGGTNTGTGGTLSERLNRSEGVITPPSGVDSGMTVRAPVPSPNSTPVITPPGEPGGNQAVQPK